MKKFHPVIANWLRREFLRGKDFGFVPIFARTMGITRAEMAQIIHNLMEPGYRSSYYSETNPFPDVTDSDWYNKAVSTVSNAGIIVGYPDGRFAPNNSITRAEFATILAKFFETDAKSTAMFADVSGHWAETYINKVASVGWVSGYPGGRFAPDFNLTRAEAMSIINRVLERKPSKDGLLPDMKVWPDNTDVNAWYYADVQEATNSHKCSYGSNYEVWTSLIK